MGKRGEIVMMGVFLLLLLSDLFHLSASASSASPFHKPLISSSADVQENNVDGESTNEKLLAREGHDVATTNRRGFGGGRGVGASHGSSDASGRGGYGGGSSYKGGGGKGNGGSSRTPYGPKTLGVIPMYVAGAANNNRNNQHHRNAAASPNHGQLGFISLRTGLILALLAFLLLGSVWM